LKTNTTLLEIGSGTGQHAVYFGEALSHILWQTSDRKENLLGISQWLDDSELPNVLPPLILDVTQDIQQLQRYDAVYMANTLHIMSWSEVEHCIKHASQLMNREGVLVVYGPFNYEGKFTSDSNARFDQWLKAGGSGRGIRDFEKINDLAASLGFVHEEDHPMPANNRLLVWRFH
jgi:cyclopropane fatty-acyl-phospholipid synthase-like methyltransferase